MVLEAKEKGEHNPPHPPPLWEDSQEGKASGSAARGNGWIHQTLYRKGTSQGLCVHPPTPAPCPGSSSKTSLCPAADTPYLAQGCSPVCRRAG